MTQAGLNIPLGDVKIKLIDAKAADAFMADKQQDINSRRRLLQASVQVAQSNLVSAEIDESNAQSAIGQEEDRQTYLTNSEYINISAELTTNQSTIETLQKAIVYLRNRTSVSVYTLSPQKIREQQTMEAALQQDSERCGELDDRDRQLSERCQTIQARYMQPLWDAYSKAQTVFNSANSAFSDATNALAAAPSIKDFLGDFNPAVIASTISGSDGKFEIPSTKSGVKAFARAQRQILDSVETYIWLVDAQPAEGQKLILSNDNMLQPSE